MINKLSSVLISLKNWQIFVIFSFLLLLAMPFSGLLPLIVSRAIYFLFVLVFVLWHYGVYNLAKQVIGRHQNTYLLFYVLLLTPLLYSVLLVVFYDFDIEKMNGNFFLNFSFGGLHLISIFSYFYLSYVNGKNIKAIELGTQPNSFSEFSNEFFLLLFFPIGVWYLQPKLNNN